MDFYIGLQFTFHVTGIPSDTFSVVRFDYKQRYSELYEVDLLLSAERTVGVDLDALLDSQAAFKVWQDGVLQGHVGGIVVFAEQGDSGFRQTFYRVKIAPQLHRLTLRRNSRIFQLKSPQDIIRHLLKEHHITDSRYLLEQPQRHTHREFCVQYRETDFEFLQRLLGEEGIFFYFEQGENEPERVVFCDKWQKLPTENVVKLPYNPNRMTQSTEKKVFTFKFARQLRPDYVQLKDYTFKKPNWQAVYQREKKAQSEQEFFHSLYSHYDYPGRYKDGRGQHYSETRLDGLRRDAYIGLGESHDIRISTVRLIELNQHPTTSFNTLWQPIAVHHHGEQAQALKEEALSTPTSEGTHLHTTFEFIPRNQAYRANFPQKPQISGPQTAVVVGPSREEVYVMVYFLQQIKRCFDIHRSTLFRWRRIKPDWTVLSIQAEITRLFLESGETLRFTSIKLYVMADKPGNRAI